jgi:hypothetical protein
MPDMYMMGSDGFYVYDGKAMRSLSGCEYQAAIQPRNLCLVATGAGRHSTIWALGKLECTDGQQTWTPDAAGYQSGLYALALAILGLAVRASVEQAKAFLRGIFHRK